MPLWKSNSAARDAVAQSAAINRSQAVIEFQMDGTIITANQNFLDAMGYRLDEIQGKHHQMFAPPELRGSEAYKAFWASLNRGEFQAGEYKRVGKGGREVWIQASYNPIMDNAGKPVKVIKFATDITEKKIRGMEDAGKISAIGRAQAVIEFNLDGTIITANENFLATVGYRLDEIQGKHHSMFVSPAERDSAAYREFWAKLGRGEYEAAEYKRFGKGGKEVWILASYNPILDEAGKPFKVVKFASDITADKLKAANYAGQIEAIGKSQAVIEFGMDGKVLTANANFLGALGYSLAEIQGKHHSLFVPADQRDGQAYRTFWANLNRGEFQSGEYERVGKGGKQIWIQASYNPIRDLNGQPFKVVKYASDTTAQVLARMRSEKVRGMMEIGRSRRRGIERLGPRNLGGDVEIPRHGADRGRAGRVRRSAGAASVGGGGVDEQHRAVDRRHHRPDQPAGAQRNNRIGARRRGGPRLCRGCLRGQEPRQSGQAGDRQDRAGNRQSQRNFRRRCRGAGLDQEGDPGSQRVRDVDRGCGRGAEHGDERDVERHAAGGGRSGQPRGGCVVLDVIRDGPKDQTTGAQLRTGNLEIPGSMLRIAPE